MKLENFTMPKCLKCGAEASIERGDNGACGDPECCGEYREWAAIVCPECRQREDLI